MPLCPNYPGVRIKRALTKIVTDARVIDIKTKTDKKVDR